MLDRITLIELFTAGITAATGVSHMLYPRLWAQLFLDLFNKPWAGLLIGALTLPLGLMIALAHNTWTLDVGLIVTIMGWAWTLKGTLYLLRPSTPQQVGTKHMQHPERFRMAGAMITVVAIVIAINALR